MNGIVLFLDTVSFNTDADINHALSTLQSDKRAVTAAVFAPSPKGTALAQGLSKFFTGVELFVLVPDTSAIARRLSVK
ncbi:MAG: hypothetical protein ACRDH5_10220, partial [bacterium]